MRIAGNEAAERNLMHYEDMLAHEAHRLRLERASEAREQGDMFMCEVRFVVLLSLLLFAVS